MSSARVLIYFLQKTLHFELPFLPPNPCRAMALRLRSTPYLIPCEILRYLCLSILLIPLINFSVLIKQEKGTFLMCVVFLCITVTHGTDESPLAFGLNRIADTTVGIVIALIINQIPVAEQKMK